MEGKSPNSTSATATNTFDLLVNNKAVPKYTEDILFTFQGLIKESLKS